MLAQAQIDLSHGLSSQRDGSAVTRRKWGGQLHCLLPLPQSTATEYMMQIHFCKQCRFWNQR